VNADLDFESKKEEEKEIEYNISNPHRSEAVEQHKSPSEGNLKEL